MRVLPMLTAAVAGILTLAGSGAQAAGPSQTLGVVLRGDDAATERQPYYRVAKPITVHIGGDAARFTSLKVTAHGPGGESVAAPLTRSGDAFSGNMQLFAPGVWTLALTTQIGTLANVPLHVVTDDAADLAARIAFGLAAIAIAAGVMLIYRAARRPHRRLTDVMRRS
jgi:hypothetical protein